MPCLSLVLLQFKEKRTGGCYLQSQHYRQLKIQNQKQVLGVNSMSVKQVPYWPSPHSVSAVSQELNE